MIAVVPWAIPSFSCFISVCSNNPYHATGRVLSSSLAALILLVVFLLFLQLHLLAECIPVVLLLPAVHDTAMAQLRLAQVAYRL